MSKVKVMVDGTSEWVQLDPAKGPLIENTDGTTTDLRRLMNGERNSPFDYSGKEIFKPWHAMSPTEQELALHQVAKKNKKLRQLQADTGGACNKLPDFLAGLPNFIQANSTAQSTETEMWLYSQVNDPDAEEEQAAAPAKEEVKLKPRKLALGEANYNPPYKNIRFPPA